MREYPDFEDKTTINDYILSFHDQYKPRTTKRKIATLKAFLDYKIRILRYYKLLTKSYPSTRQGTAAWQRTVITHNKRRMPFITEEEQYCYQVCRYAFPAGAFPALSPEFGKETLYSSPAVRKITLEKASDYIYR